MYTVVRRYTGAGPLAKAMIERRHDVEEVLRGVPGFRAYYALLTPGGTLATITVCATTRRGRWSRHAVPVTGSGRTWPGSR